MSALQFMSNIDIAIGIGGEAGQGIATPGDTKAAWFKDTEGNIMALIEPH